MKKISLLIALLSASIVYGQIPTDSLVAYYPFNGNANDASLYTNNGTVNGATLTIDRFGYANSAYHFDGDDWIEVLHDASIDFESSDNYAISVWVEMDDYTTQGQSVLEKWTNNGDPYPYIVRVGWDTVGYRVNAGAWDAVSPTASNSVTTEGNDYWLDSARFYHIVINYQSGVRYLHINDSLIDTDTSTMTSLSNNHNLFIGRRGTATNRFFNGKIDDLRIYSRGLSPNEITSLYYEGNCSLIVFDTVTVYDTVKAYSNGLVAHYPFNGNAIDESGNGNDGTVDGATLTTDRFGNANSAYYFSGSGCNPRIDMDVNTSSINGELSVSLWLTRTGNGCSGPRVFEFWPGADSASHLAMTWSNNENWPNSWYHRVSGSTTVGIGNSNTGVDVSDSVWTHMVYTNDGDSARFFQDGILISIEANPNGSNITLASDLAIGRMNHPSWDAFNGKVDDFRVYNKSLNSVEVLNLFNGNTCTVTVTDTINVYDTITVVNNVTVYDTIITTLAATDTLLINATLTGVSAPNNINLIKVYPNPASTQITIDNGNYTSMTGYSVEIKNSLGQSVYTSTINQQLLNIDLSSWTGKGVYYITILDNNSTVISSKSIIIQ